MASVLFYFANSDGSFLNDNMTLFAPFCFRCDILANRYKRVFRCGGVCQFDVDCGKYYRFCDILCQMLILSYLIVVNQKLI